MKKVTRLMIHASFTGNVRLATRLINRHGLSYQPEWQHGYKFLRIAVNQNRTAFVRFLLNRGCAVRKKIKTARPSLKKKGEKFTYTTLLYAVMNENIRIIRLLLKKGADVNRSNNRSLTPITYAVIKNNVEIVELLLDSGADVNCRAKNTRSPLHIACVKNSEEIIKILLMRGANVNVTTTGYETPLHFAARYATLDVINLLISHGANINARTEYDETPLQFAVQYAKRDVVYRLIDFGAKIDDQDEMGRTALFLAVTRGDVHIVEDILKYKPNTIYESNQTCLNLALRSDGRDFDKIVVALLNYGLTVTPESAKDPKVLLGAVEKEKLKVVHDLLKLGAPVNVADEFGRTPLHFCVIYQNESTAGVPSYEDNPVKEDSPVNLKIAQLLLDNGANIDAQSEYGVTALCAAIRKESYSITNLLLRNNPNVNLATVEGGTALHASVIENNKELCAVLLSRGANVNAEFKNGDTALHDAVSIDNTELVKLLLENGARVNSKGEKGRTPLHLVENSEIVDALWTFGANVDAKDDDGKTALHLSAERGDRQTLQTLLEYGADIDITCKRSKTAFDYAGDGLLSSEELSSFACEDALDFIDEYTSILGIAGLFGYEPSFIITPARVKLELELESMKSEIIEYTNVSYHDVLKKSTKMLAKYMKNEGVVKAFKSEEYKSKFPVCAGILTSNFRRGLVRIRLLEAANRFFQRLSHLPEDCVERIVDFLSEDDLWVLVDV